MLSVQKTTFFSRAHHLNVENISPCPHLPVVYNSLLPQDLRLSIQCTLVFFDSVAFAKLSQDLSVSHLTDKLFPDVEVLHALLINHDPLSGIACSGEVQLHHMTDLHIMKGGIVQCRSRESKQSFTSNRNPLAMTYKQFDAGMEMWAIVCGPLVEDENCSLQLTKTNLSPMDSCLKYELTDNNTGTNDTFVLRSGQTLQQGQFMYTETNTILVCADIYHKLQALQHQALNYTWLILVSVTYTVSLICLMATFIIMASFVLCQD